MIGHESVELVPNPRGTGSWQFVCECGYRSSWRPNPSQAAQAGVRHIERAKAERRAKGGGT